MSGVLQVIQSGMLRILVGQGLRAEVVRLTIDRCVLDRSVDLVSTNPD